MDLVAFPDAQRKSLSFLFQIAHNHSKGPRPMVRRDRNIQPNVQGGKSGEAGSRKSLRRDEGVLMWDIEKYAIHAFQWPIIIQQSFPL